MNAALWWLIIGVALAIAEIVAPGFYLAWVGLAALVTAGAAAAFGFGFTAQGIIFAGASFATVWVARAYFQRVPILSDHPLLNDPGARLMGTIVTAVEPVDETHGRVKVGDSVWSARGANAAVGAKLRVTAIDGGVLIVEAA